MGDQFLESQDSSANTDVTSSSTLDESVVLNALFGDEFQSGSKETNEDVSEGDSLKSAKANTGGLNRDQALTTVTREAGKIDSATSSSDLSLNLAKANTDGAQASFASIANQELARGSTIVDPSNLGVRVERVSNVSFTGSGADDYAHRSSANKILDITGNSLVNAPSMFASELVSDLTNNPGRAATTFGMGTGIGLAATGILKKAPKSGKAMLVGAALRQTYSYGSRMVDFFSDASEVNSWEQRNSLINQGSLGLAREGVLITEAAPGLVLGGGLGVRAFGKPPLYQSVQNGYQTTKAMIGDSRMLKAVKSTPPGQAIARYNAFHGRGTIDLPLSVKVPATAEVPYTRVNVMQIDDLIGGTKGNQFSVYEEARAIDVLKLKASKKITGSARAREVDMPFTDRIGHIRQHTHRPGHELPSLADVQSTRHLGIIHSGEKTTFYVGRMSEFDAAVTQAKGLGQKIVAPEVKLPIQGITLDKSSGTATLFESLAGPKDSPVSLFSRRAVKYDEAAEALSKLDLSSPWSQLKSLADGS